jgi:arylsulfatase A-like enzyme
MRNKHGYQTVELEEAWHTALEGNEKCDYTLWFEKNAPGKDINASGLHYTDHRGGVAFPFAEELHPTHWTAERAIHFLESYDGDKPWLLKVSFQRPHPPFDPPKRWLDYYTDADIPVPNVSNWAEKKYGNKKGSMEELKNPTSGNFPEEEIEASRRAYYAAISFVDEQLGRVLRALEKRGELENTLVIYTADHGDMMGDHYMWRKCRPYEGSTRIPMILRWPENLKIKAKRGQTRSELVELRDVLPTFLDAAGMQKPQIMDGASMLNILKNKSWRKIMDLEHSQIYEKDNAWVALTDGQYKYIYFTLTGQQQLFDLQNDPYEMNDLASEEIFEYNKIRIKSWRKKMIKHLQIRGEHWVKDGDLTVQQKSILIGANNPKTYKNEF